MNVENHFLPCAGIPKSGAREKRWNAARRHQRLCSFSFSGRMTGHLQKKEISGRSSGLGEETPARDGTILEIELDTDEAPAGEPGYVEPEPQNGSTTRPPGRENDWMSGVRTHRGFCVGCSRLPEYFHSITSGMGAAGRGGLPLRSR